MGLRRPSPPRLRGSLRLALGLSRPERILAALRELIGLFLQAGHEAASAGRDAGTVLGEVGLAGGADRASVLSKGRNGGGQHEGGEKNAGHDGSCPEKGIITPERGELAAGFRPDDKAESFARIAPAETLV